MEWEGILFGAILGFVTAIGANALRRRAYRKRLIDNVLKNAIMTEIEHDIDRCEIIINTYEESLETKERPEFSLSRTYNPSGMLHRMNCVEK